jgi:hypothetical protein
LRVAPAFVAVAFSQELAAENPAVAVFGISGKRRACVSRKVWISLIKRKTVYRSCGKLKPFLSTIFIRIKSISNGTFDLFFV